MTERLGIRAHTGTRSAVLKYGLGRKMSDLPIPQEEARYYEPQLQETQEHTYTISIGAAQLSLLVLYWRLFKSDRGAKIAIQVLSALVVGWLIARVRACFTKA